MSKRILISAGAVVLVVAAILLGRRGATEVAVAVAHRDTLSVTIPVEGRTRARDRFTVAAPISGRLTRLDLEEGDVVEEGQLLGQLYPAPQDPRIIATVRAEVAVGTSRLAVMFSTIRAETPRRGSASGGWPVSAAGVGRVAEAGSGG